MYSIPISRLFAQVMTKRVRAREAVAPLAHLNWALDTIAGNAFSTLTGSDLLLALAPQSKPPVYTSLVRMLWTLVFDQGFPLELVIPSSLRIHAMSLVR